jgi:hypothetical protein
MVILVVLVEDAAKRKSQSIVPLMLHCHLCGWGDQYFLISVSAASREQYFISDGGERYSAPESKPHSSSFVFGVTASPALSSSRLPILPTRQPLLVPSLPTMDFIVSLCVFKKKGGQHQSPLATGPIATHPARGSRVEENIKYI